MNGKTTLDDPDGQGSGEQSDRILISAALSGNAGAYEELCQRHSTQLYRSVLRILKNVEDAEDVLQESLVKAFTHLGSFKQTCKFSTWLTRIGINCALMQLRRRRAGINAHLVMASEYEEDVFRDIVTDLPSPEDMVSFAELSDALAEAINRLPPSLREVIGIRSSQEASMREIAASIGVSEAAVKARLHRARCLIRQTLTQQRPQFGDLA
jgi:RNA polymerase sigma-70 factor (ECF subfamily)